MNMSEYFRYLIMVLQFKNLFLAFPYFYPLKESFDLNRFPGHFVG